MRNHPNKQAPRTSPLAFVALLCALTACYQAETPEATTGSPTAVDTVPRQQEPLSAEDEASVPASVPRAPPLPADRPLTVDDVEAIWRIKPERAKLPRHIPGAEGESAADADPLIAGDGPGPARYQTHSRYEQDRETGEWVERETFRITEVTSSDGDVEAGDAVYTTPPRALGLHASDDENDASETRRRRPDMHPGAAAMVRTEVHVPPQPRRQQSREIVELTLVGEPITQARLLGDRGLEFKSLGSSLGSSEQGVMVFEEGTPWHPRDADFPVGHDLEVQFDRADGSHGRVFGRVTGYVSFGAQPSLSVDWTGLSPVFKWSAPSSSAGPITETDLRILEAGQVMWQSSVGTGAVFSVYTGPSLRPGARYRWEIEAADTEGNRGLIQSAFIVPGKH